MERKSSFGRSWGRLLRFLGVSEGWCFSMRFWDGKKSAKNRKNEQRWRPKATHRATFGWPGGLRGATGEGTMGRGQRSLHEFCMQCEAEFCRMLTCVRHALPRLEARGGGLSTRIPPGQDVLAPFFFLFLPLFLACLFSGFFVIVGAPAGSPLAPFLNFGWILASNFVSFWLLLVAFFLALILHRFSIDW